MTPQNKNIPALRFSEFEEDWKEKRLGELGSIITGNTPATANTEFYNGEFLFVSPFDIQGNRYVETTKTTLTQLGFSKGRKIRKGSSFFVCIGSTIGKVAQAKYESITNQQINSIVPIDNDDDFTYSLLEKNSNLIKSLAAEQAVPILNKTNFSNYKVFIPTLPEQQKIAAFLTAVDEKIQQLTKKKDLLEQYKKGVMQKIFNQEIRFKDNNGSDFADWEEKKLSEVCNINKGEQLNASELTLTGDYPALNGGINPSGYTDKWNKEKNTITISEGGNSCGYVNFVTQKFWCGGHCYALEDLRPMIKNLFLYQILKNNESAIMRLRVGSGLPNIQKKDVNNFLIQLPDITEQQKIANFLSAVDDKVNLVNQQLKKTKEYKKGLLQQMFK